MSIKAIIQKISENMLLYNFPNNFKIHFSYDLIIQSMNNDHLSFLQDLVPVEQIYIYIYENVTRDTS